MRLATLLSFALVSGCSTSAILGSDTAGGSDSAGGSDTSGGNEGYGDGACISGEKWTGGNEESSKMNPGQACIECHDRGEGPSFEAAGTVYTNYDEPKNCNGLSGATVRITDKNGDVYEEKTNSAGNFYFSSKHYDIKTPYTAEVEFADGTIASMAGDQTSGDCNSCHTQNGSGDAPGRISQAAAN